MASTTPTVTREIPAVLADMIGGSIIVPDPVTGKTIKGTILGVERINGGFRIICRCPISDRARNGEMDYYVKDTASRKDATGIEMYSINTGRPVVLRKRESTR